MYMLSDALARIKGLNAIIKDSSKIDLLQSYKDKFNAYSKDSCMMLNEASTYLEDMTLFKAYNKALKILIEANKATTIDEFKTTIEEFANILGEKYDFYRCGTGYFNTVCSNYSYSCENNLNFSMEMDNNNFSNNTIYNILNDIKENCTRDLTLFYPVCGAGENIDIALEIFKDSHKINIYGIEGVEYKLKAAKSKFAKVVKGVTAGSRIQNNAFDILYLQPPSAFTFSAGSPAKKIEKERVLDCLKYLREGGVAIICMPYTRLFKDTCNMLSKQLKDIRIYKCMTKNNYFEDLNLIYIVGQKNLEKEGRSDVSAKLRRLFDEANITNFNQDLGDIANYKIPGNYIEIETFKGSQLDFDELGNMLTKSNLFEQYQSTQKVEKLHQTKKQPLLPFNLGQIGLVLTSGCLDGVVDEGDNNYHVIKGRVSKQTLQTEEESEDGKEIDLLETIINKVEINILLPNGEFKTLA